VVLVSLLLVLLAAVALVVGLLQSGLTIIYVSIGCSVVAGILLAVAVVRGRPQRIPVGAQPQPQPQPQPAASTASWQSSQPSPQPEPEPERREREPAMAGARVATSSRSDETQQLDQSAIEQAVQGDEDGLPIQNYDRLRATEVLPLLANLDAGQLTVIREHEVTGRNRFMVLSRIDRELEARGESAEWDAGDDWGEPEPEAGGGRTAMTEVEEEDEVDEGFEEPVPRQPEPEPEPRAQAVRRGPAPARVRQPAGTAATGGSILDDYEHRKVLEILPRLPELSPDELGQVRRRELAGQRRMMIVNRVDRLLADAPRARPAAGSAATPMPAKKAPARKAPAKKATAKKAAAKSAGTRKATPSQKRAGAVKKTAAKKSSAKKAPAKRATKRS
jgi:hypothetical protein